MRISVLGMGNMGQALAGRLLSGGFEVVVWNRSPGRAEHVVDQGGEEIRELEEAVQGSDVVITSLTNDEAVRQVALADEGVGVHLGDGVYVDASTISPSLSGQLAERIPRFAAMPIAGSPEAVGKGEATYLVGGPVEIVAELEPLLRSLSSVHHQYQTAPLASTAKLATNLLLLVGIEALTESFEVGRAGGLSDGQLRELLAESPLVFATDSRRCSREMARAGGQSSWGPRTRGWLWTSPPTGACRRRPWCTNDFKPLRTRD
jgi:3-hydroxyisobutyrate dehydrogenase-like beta-hydroxyacid dehydrogenase